MFTQILVLLDGSKRAEQAIAVAKRLSETTHATLNLLSVILAMYTHLRPQRVYTHHPCITTDVLTTLQLPLFVV